MSGLEGLLVGPGSELRRLGRAALSGLQAALQAGLESCPDDPAAPAVRALLSQLAGLLRGAPQAAPTQGPPPLPPPVDRGAWATLLARLSDGPEWKNLLGAPALDAGAPDLPRQLAALAWRLPPDAAEAWRRQFPAGEQGGETALVAGPVDQLLLPAADGRAVRLSPAAPLDARLPSGEMGEIAGKVAPAVSACLWFSENDRAAFHMVRSVFRFGLTALNETQLPRYQKALLDRFARLRQAELDADSGELVLGWVELDEAVNGLLHQPPAHPQSLFAAPGRASRDLLVAVRTRATELGATVHLQVLGGKYADLRGVTEPDADVESAYGHPGDVVHCSRVFCRLNGKAHPGRALYRPR